MPSKPPRVEYVTVRGVPVLDDHVLENRDGTTHIDERFLREVAANNNARYERTGDATPLVIGHTRDWAPETEQPPVIGFATNFRVERFGRDKSKLAIYADFHVRKDKEHCLRDYPRRSVELWVNRKELDPIALLGATTPERDLGVLRYARSGDGLVALIESPHEAQPMVKPHRYADGDDKDTRAAEAGETSGSRDSDAKLDKLIEAVAALTSGLAPLIEMAKQAAPEGGDDDLLGPEGGAAPAGAGAAMPAPGGGAGGEEPAKYGMGGNDCYVPGTASKYSRNGHAGGVQSEEVVRMQRQLDTIRKSESETRLKLARMEAEKAVLELESEHNVEFADREFDVDTLTQLSNSPVHYRRWLDHAKKTYAKKQDPTRVAGVSRFARTEAASGPQTHDEVMAAINNLPAGLTPAEAVARIHSQPSRR